MINIVIFLIIFLILFIVVQTVTVFFLYQYSVVKTRQHDRMKKQGQFLQRWMRKELYHPGFFREKVIGEGYKRVLIYGAGILGQMIYYALDGAGIEVIGFIDRSVKEVGCQVPVYKIDKGVPKADVIIVSLIGSQKGVMDDIHKYAGTDAILIDEII